MNHDRRPAIQNPKLTVPYTALAVGYDLVMAHVDYDYWAAYAHGLLQAHHPALESILELGCGTGSLALALQLRGPYRYTATDGSAEMIRVARHKAEEHHADIRFNVVNFADFQVEEPFDAVVLLYDGLNYLLEPDGIQGLLHSAYAALRPGGVFLFDQSTPANSINNADFFEDEGRVRNFAYVRHSRYEASSHLHTTTFRLIVDGQELCEEHVQRAYTLDAVRTLVQATRFDEVAAYDDFTTDAATEDSERIHWVLRRPAD